MADEVSPPEPQPSGGGLLRTAGMIAAIVVLAGLSGLAAYAFVLAPLLRSEITLEAAADTIPISAVEVPFETTYVNLLMPSEDMPASMLLFAITLSCANQATADIIRLHRARFSDVIMKLHDGRTRSEVMSDPRVLKESIQKQVVQETNQVLRRLQGNQVNEHIRVIDALHTQFYASDSL
jgi:flagellar basal body-associated protein FliL